MRYVIDSCAWHCLRGLKTDDSKNLLTHLFGANESFLPVALTEYVARHELNQILDEILRAVGAGHVAIQRIERRDPNWKRLSRSCDKGEAEVMTWLLSLGRDVPLFVTRDDRARRTALAEGLPATDVLGLVVDMLAIGCLQTHEAQAALSIWDDKSKQICRPADWEGFSTFEARQKRGHPFGPAR
jgi:predicted nucleic acid-binding protein